MPGFLRFAQGCGCVAVLAACLLAACLDLWLTSAWCALAAGLACGAVRWRRARWMAAGLLAGLGLCFWQVPFVELGAFMDKASADIEARGAAALGTRNRVGAYGLNLVLGAFGHAAGLHEVAQLTWLLTLPDTGARQRDGAFLLRDPAVRSAARETQARGAGRVAWSRYFHPTVAPSVALAANCPLVLRRLAGGDVMARCPVRYPRQSTLRLGRVGGREVSLQEGVFWVLQEGGWLHPYDVDWWIPAPAIAASPTHAEPVLSTRERLLRHLLAP